MKLVRWGAVGAERPGLVDDRGVLRDLSSRCQDLTAVTDFRALTVIDPASLPVVPGQPRLGVPVAGIGNIICIGLNYHHHAREVNLPPPAEPVVFSKHTASLAGAMDDLILPAGTAKLDWEVELAVLIGAEAWQVDEGRALDHVAGYMTANDVSARDWQMERGGQWSKGKSAPGFCPLGPWLVPAFAVPDPQSLGLTLTVNGTLHQNGDTADMIFPVASIVSSVSSFMALQPGDVILTGTPAGVGLGKGLFLAPGDVMEAEVQGLGRQRVRIV